MTMISRVACGAMALAIAWLPRNVDAQISSAGGSGLLTSFATTCPAAGPVVSGPVTLNGGLPLARAQVTGSTDTMLAADCGGLVEYSNASSVAVTGLSASSAGSGFETTLVNLGAGAVTITSGGGNFSSTGTTTLVIAPGSTAAIESDGSNWNVASRSFPKPTRAGDVLYWSGTSWAALAGNNSGTNYLSENSSGAASWAAGTGGGASPGGSAGAIQYNTGSGFGGSPVVASGDIVTGGGSSGPQDSGTSITSDTTASLASLKIHSGYVSGNWYPPLPGIGVAGNVIASGTVYCGPMTVGIEGVTIKALGAYQSTLSATSDNFSVAIYTSSSGKPYALIDYATMAELATTGIISATVHNTTDALKGGDYWICSTQDNSTGAFASYSSGTNIPSWFTGSSSLSKATLGTNAMTGYSCTSASTCGSGFTTWSAGAFGWTSTFSGATWAEVNSGSYIPFSGIQAN